MPRTKKAAGHAVDPRNGRRTEMAAAVVERFALSVRDQGWRPEVVEAWDAFWEDPVSRALTPVDVVVVRRWADHLHRALAALERADAEPVAKGSMGQQVQSPHYTIAGDAMRVVERCEQQLGIGALNRARLGIAIVSERASLAALNERYVERGTPDDEPDPRLISGHAEP